MRYDQAGTYANTGTISDGVVIGAAGVRLTNTQSGRISGGVIFTASGSTLVNEAGGTIQPSSGVPAVTGSTGDDTVINAGGIYGSLTLGAGNDTLIDRDGVIQNPSLTGTAIDLGAGDDTYRVEGRGFRFLKADGGEGRDRVVIANTNFQIDGGDLSGFEDLVFEEGGNLQRFSGYRSITLAGTDPFYFSDSFNPLIDLSLAGQSLALRNSSIRTVTGSAGRDFVELGLGAMVGGNILLGDGDDGVTLSATGDNATIGAVAGRIDAGGGRDQLELRMTGEGVRSFDLARFGGFDTLSANGGYTYKVTLQVANLAGVGEVFVGQKATLALSASSLPAVNVSGGYAGGLVIAADAAIGRYGPTPGGPFNPQPDQVQADPTLSTTIANAGSITGDVQFYIGDDLYDGRAGRVGGTVAGNAGNDTLLGGSGNERFNGGYGGDTIDGGAGLDTAIFANTRAEHRITRLGDGVFEVQGPEGVDRISNVERFQFRDGAVSTLVFPEEGAVTAILGSSIAAGGWTSATAFPRTAADVNGDKIADLIGFGNAGTYVALGDGKGGFGALVLATGSFGASAPAGGWSDATIYPRLAADLNGDGRADLVGFGNAGVYAALARADGSFGSITLVNSVFGAAPEAGGWSDANAYPRTIADINGDGRADLVGFGNAGVYVALGTGTGSFGTLTLVASGFGRAETAGGWTDAATYPRLVADLNADGRADLIGFGKAGVYAALASADGGFGSTRLVLSAFGSDPAAGGWSDADAYPRTVADVNGDKIADLIGFGNGGVYVALGDGRGGFATPRLDAHAFGLDAGAGGWTGNAATPRLLVDLNADGRADLLGFHADGVHLALATDLPLIG